jgi:hypothetical protein
VEPEFKHLDYVDYYDELENRKWSMFWDSLDMEASWKNIIRLFLIRFAFTMVQVHLKKHPDEIFQGKEIAYQLLNMQSETNMNGVQSFSTWEWWKGYNLRTHLYPLYLSIPGFILKKLDLDTNFLVINSIYFMHCLMWVIGDCYMYSFTRQLLGRREAIAALAFSLTSEYVNDYVLRTSANSVEGNMMFIVFYHYLNLQPKMFDRSLTILTIAVTISFTTRSSSIVGYIPLALLKILQDWKYFLPMLVAALTIALPFILINLWFDAILYGYWTVP